MISATPTASRTWSRTSRTPGHRRTRTAGTPSGPGACSQTTSGSSIPAAVDFATFQGFRNYIEANSAYAPAVYSAGGGGYGSWTGIFGSGFTLRTTAEWTFTEESTNVAFPSGWSNPYATALFFANAPARCQLAWQFSGGNGDINLRRRLRPDRREQRQRHQVRVTRPASAPRLGAAQITCVQPFRPDKASFVAIRGPSASWYGNGLTGPCWCAAKPAWIACAAAPTAGCACGPCAGAWARRRRAARRRPRPGIRAAWAGRDTVEPMDDKEIMAHIDDLIKTEHELRAKLAAGRDNHRRRAPAAGRGRDGAGPVLGPAAPAAGPQGVRRGSRRRAGAAGQRGGGVPAVTPG